VDIAVGAAKGTGSAFDAACIIYHELFIFPGINPGRTVIGAGFVFTGCTFLLSPDGDMGLGKNLNFYIFEGRFLTLVKVTH
jgi:hypothetical protein